MTDHQTGLIRIGGQLKSSNLPDEHKYPILSPSYQYVTDLIISFWVFGGKNQIRKIIRNCITCIRHLPNPVNCKMADLPDPRIQSNVAILVWIISGPCILKKRNGKIEQH